jgi:hypothetical protein
VQKQARPQVSTACAWLTPWIERQHWRSSTRVSSQKQHFRSLAAGLHLCKAPAAGGPPWKGNILRQQEEKSGTRIIPLAWDCHASVVASE